jgi:hypothetical protein
MPTINSWASRLTEARAVLRRDEETLDHLGIYVVAVGVQLIQPVLITRGIRVASQVAESIPRTKAALNSVS